MAILFTGLEASPWIWTESAALAVLDAGADDLVELQPPHANTTAAANTAAREYHLNSGISRPSIGQFIYLWRGDNTHRCLEIDWKTLASIISLARRP
jgi:hypothetical protein